MLLLLLVSRTLSIKRLTLDACWAQRQLLHWKANNSSSPKNSCPCWQPTTNNSGSCHLRPTLWVNTWQQFSQLATFTFTSLPPLFSPHPASRCLTLQIFTQHTENVDNLINQKNTNYSIACLSISCCCCCLDCCCCCSCLFAVTSADRIEHIDLKLHVQTASLVVVVIA